MFPDDFSIMLHVNAFWIEIYEEQIFVFYFNNFI